MSDRRIGHNRNLNKTRSVFVAVCAVFPLFPAVHMLTFLQSHELYLAAIPGDLGLGVLWWAWWIWKRPPKSRAFIEFHEDGFFVEMVAPMKQFEHDINWSDLREIRSVKGGYGVRNLDLVLTHEASERLGLVQPTTRAKAPDLLVGRKLSILSPLLELGSDQVIAVMTEAADRAGFVIEKSGWREYLVLSDVRYSVTPKA